MCNRFERCEACPEFSTCSTEFQDYIHDLEEVTEDYPDDDSDMRWW